MEGTSQHESVRLKEEHTDEICLFCESIDVEKTLIKQIVTAVESKYFDNIYSPVTNTITADVPTILIHLFPCSGQVPLEGLFKSAQDVKAMMYDVIEYLITVFQVIEYLKPFREAGTNPLTVDQLTEIGIQILKNSHKFETGLIN